MCIPCVLPVRGKDAVCAACVTLINVARCDSVTMTIDAFWGAFLPHLSSSRMVMVTIYCWICRRIWCFLTINFEDFRFGTILVNFARLVAWCVLILLPFRRILVAHEGEQRTQSDVRQAKRLDQPERAIVISGEPGVNPEIHLCNRKKLVEVEEC